MNQTNEKEIICVHGLTKKFKLGSLEKGSALSNVLRFLSVNNFSSRKIIDALHDISFTLNKGENLGIVGKNGSGKSTLLRILSGIYEPTSGLANIQGRVVYINGFGQGINPRLTMGENIDLICAFMGLGYKETKKIKAEIISFSELGDYLDTEVFKFSTGMVTRLGFSISIHCLGHINPDIILIDEAISAGVDASFKKKSEEKIESLINSGATCIIVSHDLNQLQKYCDQVIWMEKGKIIKSGAANDVLLDYTGDPN